MRFESLPQIVGIGFGQFATLSTGFRRNDGLLFFAARQDSPVTFLQVTLFTLSQLLVGTFRYSDAGFLQ